MIPNQLSSIKNPLNNVGQVQYYPTPVVSQVKTYDVNCVKYCNSMNVFGLSSSVSSMPVFRYVQSVCQIVCNRLCDESSISNFNGFDPDFNYGSINYIRSDVYRMKDPIKTCLPDIFRKNWQSAASYLNIYQLPIFNINGKTTSEYIGDGLIETRIPYSLPFPQKKRPFCFPSLPHVKFSLPLAKYLKIASFALICYVGLCTALQWKLREFDCADPPEFNDFPTIHQPQIQTVINDSPATYGYDRGDYFIVLNQYSYTDDNGIKYIQTRNGFVVDGTVLYRYPTTYVPILIKRYEHFTVYQCGYSVLARMIQQEYTNRFWHNPIKLVKAFWDLFTINHKQLSQYSGIYSYMRQRVGHNVIEDNEHSVALHIDYDHNAIDVIPYSAYDRAHNQARAAMDPSKFNIRLMASLSSMSQQHGLQIAPQTCIAVYDVYIRLRDKYKYATTSPRKYDFVWGLPELRKPQVYNRVCFHANDFKPQKPSSFVDGDNECIEEDQQWYSYVNGWAKNNITYPKNCPCNGYRAIKNRSNCLISDFDPQSVNELISFWRDNITKVIDVTSYSSITRETWLDSLEARKRELKRQGGELNDEAGFIDNTTTKAFVKMEPYNFKQNNENQDLQDLDPRVISGRYSEYDAYGGPIIKRLSKLLASIWSYKENNLIEGTFRRIPGITYFSSGHNKASIGEWFELVHEGYHLYNTDYSRFDASTNRGLLTLEHLVLTSLYGDNIESDFGRWLGEQLRTRGTMTWGKKDLIRRITYGCEGTRKSGDQNTSLGNTLVNVLVQLYALHKITRRSIDDLLNSGDVKILALGDDTVVATRFSIDATYAKHIRDLGLKITIDEKSKHTVRFCSSYFVPAMVNGRESYVLTQLPGRNLTRAYTSHLWHEDWKAWVKTNAYAYMQDYRHLPFMYYWHSKIYNKHSDQIAKPVSYYIDNSSFEHAHISRTINVGVSDHIDSWMNEVYHIPTANFTVDGYNIVEKITNGYAPYAPTFATTIIDTDVYDQHQHVLCQLTYNLVGNMVKRGNLEYVLNTQCLDSYHVDKNIEQLIIPDFSNWKKRKKPIIVNQRGALNGKNDDTSSQLSKNTYTTIPDLFGTRSELSSYDQGSDHGGHENKEAQDDGGSSQQHSQYQFDEDKDDELPPLPKPNNYVEPVIRNICEQKIIVPEEEEGITLFTIAMLDKDTYQNLQPVRLKGPKMPVHANPKLHVDKITAAVWLMDYLSDMYVDCDWDLFEIGSDGWTIPTILKRNNITPTSFVTNQALLDGSYPQNHYAQPMDQHSIYELCSLGLLKRSAITIDIDGYYCFSRESYGRLMAHISQHYSVILSPEVGTNFQLLGNALHYNDTTISGNVQAHYERNNDLRFNQYYKAANGKEYTLTREILFRVGDYVVVRHRATQL